MIQYHKPDSDGVARIAELRKAYADLDKLVEKNCPDSVDRHDARRALKKSMMWANSAIALEYPAEEN